MFRQREGTTRAARPDGIASIAEETASASTESASSTEELTASMEDMTIFVLNHFLEMAMNLQRVASRFKIDNDVQEENEVVVMASSGSKRSEQTRLSSKANGAKPNYPSKTNLNRSGRARSRRGSRKRRQSAASTQTREGPTYAKGKQVDELTNDEERMVLYLLGKETFVSG